MTARAPEDLDVARLNAQGRRASIVDANRSRYARLRERGLCTRAASHGPAEDGGSLCGPCMVDRRYDQMEYYRRTHDTGPAKECTRCGRVGHNARSCTNEPLPHWAGPDTARIERDRARRARRRKAGVCLNNPAHGPPLKGYVRCKACAHKRRKVNS